MKKLSTLLTIITVTSFSQLFSMDRQVSTTVADRSASTGQSTALSRINDPISDLDSERSLLITELEQGKAQVESQRKTMQARHQSHTKAIPWLTGGTATVGSIAWLARNTGQLRRGGSSAESSPAGVAIKWGAIGLTVLGTIKIITNALNARNVRGIVEQQQDQIVEAGALIKKLTEAQHMTAEELQALRGNVVTNAKAIHKTAEALGDLADVVQEEKEKNLPTVQRAPSGWFR